MRILLVNWNDRENPQAGGAEIHLHEIFGRLAAQWTDHIPPTYATSLDPALHRAGPLQLMVDGIFATADYGVSEVVLHQGVSDHCAITARVAKGSDPMGAAHPQVSAVQ